MDDVPIGGGAGDKMMNAPSSSDQADNSGPLEKRIISKNWKTRADAYDELATLCDNSKIDSKKKSEIICKLAEIDQSLVKGCDEHIQFMKIVYFIMNRKIAKKLYTDSS